MSIVPIAPTLATAIDWSGVINCAATWSRLSRMASAWVARSTWPRPIRANQSWVGATMDPISARMVGMEATNSVMEVDSAWATRRMRKTSAPTIAV